MRRPRCQLFQILAARPRRPYPGRVATTYRLVLLVKLLAVLLYAGGLVASLISTVPAERKRAVHGIASPALLAIWATGYGLTAMQGISMGELWILASLGLSLASQLGLVFGVSRAWRPAVMGTAAGLPLIVVVALMVFKPTWAAMLGRPS